MVRGDSLWALLEARVTASPDAVMAIDERGEDISFATFQQRARDVAAGLRELGVAPGTTVAWQLPTWIEAMVLAAALARLGAVQAPIIPSFRSREVAVVVAESGAQLLVVPTQWRGFDFQAMAEDIAARSPALRVLPVDPRDRRLPVGDPGHLDPLVPPGATGPEDDGVRWLYYTSGTTSRPKGARHTDTTLLGAVPGMLGLVQPTAADRNAMVFPFAHIGGLVWLLTGLTAGSTHLLAESFDPATTIPMLAANGVTLAGTGTPFNLAYLAAQRELATRRPGRRLFPSVRLCMSGASPKPPSLHAELRAELGCSGIVSSYGLTEAPILTYCGPDDPDELRATTEGRAAPGVELRTTDPDGLLRPPGEEGEIRVRGPQLCRGYVGAHLLELDADGFLRTGDLGVLDADGFLTVTGRLKDVIIRKGENISAKEVEDLLFRHPEVRDVAVIGLPDAALGERCCAVVAPADPEHPLAFEEMATYLAEQELMRQKIPEQLEIVAEVPRNVAGKVVKQELRDRFA